MRSIPVLRRLSPELKLKLKDSIPAWAIHRFRPNAIRTLSSPSGATHGGGIPLFALVCTWNEADIIYASVSHAFRLGAAEVFLMDNGSADATISEAEAAGARHVMTFTTDSFDELFKYKLINEQVRQRSRSSSHDRIWWMMMDADEFSNTTDGEPLPDLLSMVDRRCRVVGARVFDHYPTPALPYMPRTDPLDVQPMCREKVDHRCQLGHHKHPVFLWDRHRPEIVVEPGFHQLRCTGEALYEPDWSLLLHHFPFRNEADSRERLELLAVRGFADHDGVEYHAHVKSRMAALSSVYSARYNEIPDHLTGQLGIRVVDWREIDAR